MISKFFLRLRYAGENFVIQGYSAALQNQVVNALKLFYSRQEGVKLDVEQFICLKTEQTSDTFRSF